MAPEMLFKSEYDYRVDIWALGVLLYEMLHGFAPFKGKNAADVQEAMLRGDYEFASHLSEQVKALIGSVLQFQADKRPSLEEILRHQWVTDMTAHINAYLEAESIALPK
jgi:serine/threonine protein kinase